MKPALARDDTDLLIEDLPSAQIHLRLAVVTETYPPEVNGVSLSLARVVQGLRERGHDVQLVRPRQGADKTSDKAAPRDTLRPDILTRGLPIPRYPHLQLGLPSRRQLLALWKVHRPDLVHIATEGPLGWSALKAAKKLRIPVTSDFRTNFHAYSSHYVGVGWLSKPIMAYLRKFHNQCDVTMTPTRALARQLSAAGYERLHTVARGVDLTRFDPALRDEALRASWGAKPDTPVLMCVGRIAKEKNLALLVRAWQQARQARPDLKLVLVGDGPYREELQAELRPWKDDVVFSGVQQGEALARHYASGDIFGFPSMTETFGNVVLEAMSSGLAVVAFDYAAAAEHIVPGHCGLLAPFNDDAAFIRQVAQLAHDTELRAHLRSHARAAAQHCDWSDIVAQVESVMKQTIMPEESLGKTQAGAAQALAV